MSYSKGDIVSYPTPGDKAQIVATKDDPYKDNNDPYRRSSIFPKKGYDYVVKTFAGTNEDGEVYTGEYHVNEQDISSYEV